MKRAAVIAALALAATGLVACGGGGDDSDGGADAPEKSAWQQVLDGIRDDSTVPKQTALQAFSLAIGPLPGVDVPEGEVGSIFSGSAAILWLQDYFEELTRAQQDAARRLVPGIDESAGTGVGAGRSRALRFRGPQPVEDSESAAEYRPTVEEMAAAIGDRLGTGPLPFKIQIVVPIKDHPTAAMGTLGSTSGCTIFVFPGGAAYGAPDRRFGLAHEVFHCYQRWVTGAKSPWVIEGMATWAAGELVPNAPLSTAFWDVYLTTPGKGLFSRAYDGRGFFSHLQYTGVDVWASAVPIIDAVPDNATAFGVAVGSGGASLDDWPSGYLRDAGKGKHWDTDGAGITSGKPKPLAAAMNNGSVWSKNVASVTNLLATLDVGADVFLFDVAANGHARLPDGKDGTLQQMAEQPWCTLGGCECPEGSPGAGTTFSETMTGVAFVGVTGGLDPAKITLRGLSLAEFCGQAPKDPEAAEPPPTGLDRCLIGEWVSTSFQPAVAGQGAVTYQGGAGAVFTIAPDGAATIDFDPMAPLTGALSTGAVSEFGFKGQVGGRISTSGNEIFTLEATNNTWQYFGIAQVPGAGAFPFEGAVQSDPAVGNFQATYTCSRTTLEYAVTGQGGFSTGSAWART